MQIVLEDILHFLLRFEVCGVCFAYAFKLLAQRVLKSLF